MSPTTATGSSRFQECGLYGKTNEQLAAVLQPADLFDPGSMYGPQGISHRLAISEDEVSRIFKGKRDEHTWLIDDVRDRLGYHPKAWGHSILAWLETRPDIKARPDAIVLRQFRREHPALFRTPLDQCDLGERMRRENHRIQQEAEAAEQQRQADQRVAQYDRLAEILARYDGPQDGDVAAILELSAALGLDEVQIEKLARRVREVTEIERRRTEAAKQLEQRVRAHAEVRSAFDTQHGERHAQLVANIEKARKALESAESRLRDELGEPWSTVTDAEAAVNQARRELDVTNATIRPKLDAIASKHAWLFSVGPDGWPGLKYSVDDPLVAAAVEPGDPSHPRAPAADVRRSGGARS